MQVAAHSDTIYGQQDTQTRLQSETADNITWARYAAPLADPESEERTPRVLDALSRMEFVKNATSEGAGLTGSISRSLNFWVAAIMWRWREMGPSNSNTFPNFPTGHMGLWFQCCSLLHMY